MTWFVIALIVLAAGAGAGAKWAVDRIWPPYDAFEAALRIVAAELAKPSARPPVSDDTIEKLADGFAAGARSTVRSVLPAFGIIPGQATPSGGFNSGPAPGNGYREQGVWTETP